MKTEVIKPRNKAMTAKERVLTAELFRKRYEHGISLTIKSIVPFV